MKKIILIIILIIGAVAFFIQDNTQETPETSEEQIDSEIASLEEASITLDAELEELEGLDF